MWVWEQGTGAIDWNRLQGAGGKGDWSRDGVWGSSGFCIFLTMELSMGRGLALSLLQQQWDMGHGAWRNLNGRLFRAFGSPQDAQEPSVGRGVWPQGGGDAFQGVISALSGTTKLPLPLDNLLPKQPPFPWTCKREGKKRK